ncbi:MAG: hypothetical protein HYZ42_04030 [Bacteroidetes bacterium]|nr:hypothetical protein [Bacteroidota bacterium]
MKLTPVVTYSDIYKEEVPDIEILLEDISLNDALFCLSYINAQITNSNDKGIQSYLLNRFLESFPKNEKEYIRKRLNPMFEKNIESIIFNVYTNMSFLDYVLFNKDLFKHEGKITPKNEADFFKAYLIFSHNIFNSNELLDNSIKNNDELSFQKLTWLVLKGQMQFVIAYEKDYLLFRLAVFFNYFKIDKYATYLDNYVSKFGKVSYWEIIFRLIEIYSLRYKKDSKDLYVFLISSEQGDSILENLCINLNSYKTGWKPNFDLIKSKPLFKVDNNKYLVDN